MQAVFEKLKLHMTVENKKLTEENEKLSSECQKVVKREKELEELLNTKNEELISSEEICKHKEVNLKFFFARKLSVFRFEHVHIVSITINIITEINKQIGVFIHHLI